MKPLGTITKDLPFLDEHVRDVILRVMENASDYSDFAIQLSILASESDYDSQLVFISWWHAMRLYDNRALDRIEEVYSDRQLIEPCYIPELSENATEIRRAVEEALSTDPGDAIAFYLLLRVLQASDIGTEEERWAREVIEELLSKNDLLKRHSAYYMWHLGRQLRFEGSLERAYEKFTQALEIAEEYDDRKLKAGLILQMAEIEGMFSSDIESHAWAREHILDAADIYKSLGDKAGLSGILNYLSLRAIRRGEYAEAIASQLEGITVMESIEASIAVPALNLSYYYAMVGEGANALEWAKVFCEKSKDVPDRAPFENLVMASAHIELGRLNKARKFLDAAKEQVMKHGQEMALGVWYFISGLLDWKEGDLESALHNLRQAYDINKRANRQIRLNWCLVHLALLELELFNPTKENNQNEVSGPWMKRYEEIAHEDKAPGHFARLLLMKAELRMKQGRHEEANELVSSAINLTEREATAYLHQKALDTRDSWIEEGLLPVEESNVGKV